MMVMPSSHLFAMAVFALSLLDANAGGSVSTSLLRGVRTEGDETQPLKVFLLAGQSNMVGMASIPHLRLLINGTSDGGNCRCEYQTLWNGTNFRERDDVYMQYNERRGKLTVGTGFAARDKFGPELGFGWAVGDALQNETVVLIKAAYGGRSLAVDFRPPASGEGDYNKVKPSHYGWEYRQMITDINDGLKSLKETYPDYDEKAGYEIAGFVWFQGWNDVINGQMVKEYAFNLANLLRDVRKEVDAPDMPIIVGELGQSGLNPHGRGSDRHIAMREAEQAVTLLPEFQNTSLFVRTAPYVIENGTTYNGGFHYKGRADTYYHIGKAFGHGMLQLLGVDTMSTKEEPCDRSESTPYEWAASFFSAES